VVCSACGFENLAGMHFCGMCGTPLPHRPLTTPGAQSTLSLTRVPLEGGVSSPGRSTSSAGSRTVVSPGMPGTDGGTAATDVTAPWGAGDPAADAEDIVPASDQQPTELVPDVPLDEYLRSFQYRPPDDPDEISMRGDASVAEQPAASAEKTTVARSAPVGTTTPADANASTTAAEIETPTVIADVPADTVESRLGLEPEAPEDIPLQRPKFLDLGEAPAETEPARSGTSFITGPSFLGLNDPPETRAGFGLPKPRKVRRSHWGAWSAAAVVLIFAGLGWMQYRSQVDHTNNGPVEIVKAKISEWRQRILSRVGSEPAPANSVATNRKPHMQVQPQPRNQGDNTNEPVGEAASSAAQTSATAGATPSFKPPLVSTTLQPTTAAGGAAAKPAAAAGISNQEAAPKPSLAGAEEMAKAKNASDAAAIAAWLWKATAKGNPDAPVQLADMYIGGQGVPRSCEQAEVLLKTAAEKENARARNRLASMYATGTCVTRDRVQAYRWLSSALSANPNSDWAKQNRDLIWQQMTLEERAQAEKYR